MSPLEFNWYPKPSLKVLKVGDVDRHWDDVTSFLTSKLDKVIHRIDTDRWNKRYGVISLGCVIYGPQTSSLLTLFLFIQTHYVNDPSKCLLTHDQTSLS